MASFALGLASQQSEGQVAQLVEHGPEKAGVGGSSPPLSTSLERFQNSSLLISCRVCVAKRNAPFRAFRWVGRGAFRSATRTRRA